MEGDRFQLHHHAAYLYWGLRGALAEKWAHGPYFAAYSVNENELRLTRASGKPSTLTGVFGLKRTAFAAEQPDAFRRGLSIVGPAAAVSTTTGRTHASRCRDVVLSALAVSHPQTDTPARAAPDART